MPTSVRLPEDLERRLEQLVTSTQRPLAFYLREAIARGLPELEYEYGIAQRAADVRAGRVPTITLDELTASLDLDR